MAATALSCACTATYTPGLVQPFSPIEALDLIGGIALDLPV
jgi:hypothetical protein